MRRDFALVLALPLLLSACGQSIEAGTQNQTSSKGLSATRAPEPLGPGVTLPKRAFTPDERDLVRSQIKETNDQDITGPTFKLALQAVVACDLTQYAQLDGAALVKYIQDAGTSCVYGLMDGTPEAFGAFTKAKMISVADATAALAQAYTGQDLDNLEALYLWLRAGYYVAYNWSASVPWRDPVAKTYDTEVVAASLRAIDGFVANAHFTDSTAANGKVLTELFTLMDSAESQGNYLPAMKSWLRRWDPTCAATSELRTVIGKIFSLLQRGQGRASFDAAVANDTELVDLLGAMVDMTWMNRTDAGVVVADAAWELGRLLRYKTAPVYSAVQAKVKDILSRYQLLDAQYISVADGAAYFDDCALYGVCTFKNDAIAKLLTVDYNCSSTIHLRAQEMTPEQITQTCTMLQAEESYFHYRMKTNNVPVTGDTNSNLDIIVFDDSRAYQIYAYVLFWISTDNGGMYIEGNPAYGTKSTFYCYEKETLRPAFVIWNLEHEYVHYLDGRFNMWGGWDDLGVDNGKVVWWMEGLAEYLSKREYYDAAITFARTKQYPISTIFENNYSSGSTRVYRWGYLAVRFMSERHPEDVAQILQFFRAGRYVDYLTWLNARAVGYDAEWFGWLDTVLSLPPGTATPIESGKAYRIAGTKDSTTMYYIDLPANVSRLEVETEGGRGDVDMFVKRNNLASATDFDCRSAHRGTNEECEFNRAVPARYFVMLKGRDAFERVELKAIYWVKGSNKPVVARLALQ